MRFPFAQEWCSRITGRLWGVYVQDLTWWRQSSRSPMTGNGRLPGYTTVSSKADRRERQVSDEMIRGDRTRSRPVSVAQDREIAAREPTFRSSPDQHLCQCMPVDGVTVFR